MPPIASTGFAAIHYGCAPIGVLMRKRGPGMPARTAMEDQTIRFHNAVNLNDVLLVTEHACVRNRFHCGLTPVVPDGRRRRGHFGHKKLLAAEVD